MVSGGRLPAWTSHESPGVTSHAVSGMTEKVASPHPVKDGCGGRTGQVFRSGSTVGTSLSGPSWDPMALSVPPGFDLWEMAVLEPRVPLIPSRALSSPPSPFLEWGCEDALPCPQPVSWSTGHPLFLGTGALRRAVQGLAQMGGVKDSSTEPPPGSPFP